MLFVNYLELPYFVKETHCKIYMINLEWHKTCWHRLKSILRQTSFSMTKIKVHKISSYNNALAIRWNNKNQAKKNYINWWKELRVVLLLKHGQRGWYLMTKSYGNFDFTFLSSTSSKMIPIVYKSKRPASPKLELW